MAYARIHVFVCLLIIVASIFAIREINAYYQEQQRSDTCRYLGQILSRELALPNSASLIEDRCNKQK